MAKTNNTGAVSSDVKEVTLRWKVFTDGLGLVFAGVMSMLEALDADTVKDFLNGNLPVLGDTDTEEVFHADEKAQAGPVAADPGNSPGSLDDSADVECKVENGPGPEEEVAPEVLVTPQAQGVTLDDVTKIIVQKIKQSRSNNAKIGSILKTYGAAKVSDLPPEKYEAFLTDLAQL